MQPTPTSSLLAGGSPRLRAGALTLHVSLFGALLILAACRDPKVTTYRVPKEPAAELPATKPIHDGPQSGGAVPAAVPVATAGAAETPALPPNHPAMPGASGALPPNHPAMGDSGAASGGPALQTASGNGLTWTAPATWATKPAGMMRKATYVISGDGGATAELAISAFPGDVGGDIANVNRWRGQVGLAPLNDADALASIARFQTNSLSIGVVDVIDASAANATHLIGAIVPFDGATWFFKLTGPDAVVSPQKAAFVDFIKTIKPALPATP